MVKFFSALAAALVMTASVGAFQPSVAAQAYGQHAQTGSYAAGGSNSDTPLNDGAGAR